MRQRGSTPTSSVTTTPDTTAVPTRANSQRIRTLGRYVLAAALTSAGIGHLSWARIAFRDQVPDWVPMDADTVVLLSGAVEMALGLALLRVRSKWTGWIVGAFFVAVFPGNIAQFLGHKDAFGLDTDAKRALRLLFQPVLVAWAIWSTSGPRLNRQPDVPVTSTQP